MAGWLRRGRARRVGQWRRWNRRTGCLLWLLVVIIIVIALGLMFGGFRKGTKAGSIGAPAQLAATPAHLAAATPAHLAAAIPAHLAAAIPAHLAAIAAHQP